MGTHNGHGGAEVSDCVIIITTAFIGVIIVKTLRIIIDFIVKYYES